MFPVFFEIGGVKLYSYGLMIAVGTIAGVSYMAFRGKKETGLTFDQANSLFLLIFFAALIGGKVFLFFENADYYSNNFSKLLSGNGFVFYGSFLFAVPAMLFFFRRYKISAPKMLDVMAITTCLVHAFGRIGCFFAGCCYGLPTDGLLAVTFTDAASYAEPLHTPLHPTQLYESVFIFLVMGVLLLVRDRRTFYGQLFLLYLIFYAVGRFCIEYLRGDLARGYVIDGVVTHSQFIAAMIFLSAILVYVRMSSMKSLAVARNVR